MKQRTNVALLTALVAATGWSQDVSVTSTTIAQVWKQDTPGFDKRTMAPATQFLGIDATKLGDEALSLHLFGWGQVDLADSSDPSDPDRKSRGNFSIGYLQYRFAQANAELKAGRFAISQGGGVEHVDGVSARTDLRGGFAVSAFAGRPVRFRTNPTDPLAQRDYEFQQDFIFGTRLSYRMQKFGEVGLSYLQDGTKAAQDLDLPSVTDYTRRQVGFDLRVTPIAIVDFTGRTVFDIAKHPDVLPGAESPSRIAEHDYTVAVKVVETVSITGGFVERNFRAYFAGTTLPSLFNQDEKGKFSAYTLSAIWGPTADLKVVADYRHTKRETFGAANRFGADLRWQFSEWKLQTGFGFHRVNAADVQKPGELIPSYGISHLETRAWAMYDGGFYFASLEGIHQQFDDKHNPNLNGKGYAAEVVASLGIRPAEDLKISGDVVLGTNAEYRKDVRGLLRVEYRFGLAGKGGRK